MLAVALATCGLAIAPSARPRVPGVCPPICDAIPDSAWIAPTAIPLDSVYHWPGLAGLAVTAPATQFGFEALCDSPPVAGDPATMRWPRGRWCRTRPASGTCRCR